MATQGTYTPTNLPYNGETIDASQVNTDLGGLIDEFNLPIDISSTKIVFHASTSWNPAPAGFSPAPTITIQNYIKIGYMVFCWLGMSGTSVNTSIQIVLPFTPAQSVVGLLTSMQDASVALTTPGQISITAGNTSANIYKDSNADSFTASGTKGFNGMFFYESTT